MQVRQRSLLAGVMMAALVVAPLAEAKRAGGGKSHGMSRSATPTQSYQRPSQNAAPAQQTAPTAGSAQRSGPGVGSMVAAGVAGAAVGAVAANAMANDRHSTSPEQQATQQEAAHYQQQQEEKRGIPGWIWIILAAAVAFFIFRRFGAKKKLAGNNPFAPNNSGSNPNTQSNAGGPFGRNAGNDNTNIFGQNVGGGTASNTAPSAPFGAAGAAYSNNGNQLPDGTEPAAFLRIARQRFNHIQSVNSASNVEEIRRYLTPELYASMRDDILSNQDQDVAEFSNLNAMVVDTATENGQYVVSVRFTGTVSEDLNSLPQPFAETWHFVKPAGSQQDWLVAGIQQS